MTDREQEAIERMAKTMFHAPAAKRDGVGMFNAVELAKAALDALLSPSPCPTCGGTRRVWDENIGHDCHDCNGTGTVPPLLRWNEEA